MLAFGLVMGCALIDRTGTLNVDNYELSTETGSLSERKLKIKNLYPVPPLDLQKWADSSQARFRPELIPTEDDHNNACSKLSEILLERAKTILENARHERKGIQILWSGGIDTTAVVTAFDQVIGNQQHLRDFVKICFCESSKSENPLFFDKIIKGRFSCFQIPKHVRDIFNGDNKNRILVTGDPADMMFGTYVMSQCILDPPELRSYYHKPYSPLYMKLESDWHIFADFMVFKGLLSPEAKPNWLKWITPFVTKCPISVKTVFDFLWWCSYALKYQHDLNRTFYNNEYHTIPDEMISRVVNFYDTSDFSQWSYHFHYSKMKSKLVWASYKHALKDFIRGYYPFDMVYYSAKLKVQSVSNNWGFEHGLDSNYNLIR